MALYPGATYKPTSYGGRVPRNKQGRGMLHVAVSNAKSLPPSSVNTWHFYIAKAAPDGSTDGSGGPAYCEQYVDTEFRAYGGAEGNDDQIIVETAGGLGASPQLNAEEWTPAQMLRIADLMRWEADQPGGAPLELLPDARPGRRGWGPHRLGIKHSAGPRPGWWQPGSELWSNSLGKECPGDAKVRQIPQAIEMARNDQEDDMPSEADVRRIVHEVVWGKTLAQVGGGGDIKIGPAGLEDFVRHGASFATQAAVNSAQIATLTAVIERLAGAIASDDRNDWTEDQLRNVFREETEAAMKKIVDVQVTVRDGDESAT